MKHELLVPVGSKEALKEAINNGADAVYLAGKCYGARKFAQNFTNEELVETIKLCHLYDVKVFVTVNTLIWESEIKDAFDYILFLHQNGVDAVIMQDIGMINYVHRRLPNLEIHASTQANVHNEDTIKFLENLGVKRVVCARELSLDSIKKIKTNLELEVFIHGALCISFSGECLFSSMILNRSGNRGECAGMCRLPYNLVKNNHIIPTEGEYLLSPKELCSIDNFKELLDSNIYSFKIEGRMKSPEYVGVVTRIYKTLMIQYEKGETLKVDDKDYKLLVSIYNREFTKGFLFNDKNIMNFASPNHQGLLIGTVTKIDKKIHIKLKEDIKQFDSIRFSRINKGLTINYLYDSNDNLINSGKSGEIVKIKIIEKVNKGDEVYLTNPFIQLTNEITKKIGITLDIVVSIKGLIVTARNNDFFVTKQFDVVERAQNAALSKDTIIKQMGKVGNTPFEIKDIKIDLSDDLFIRVSDLNESRRIVLSELEKLKKERKKLVVIEEFEEPKTVKKSQGLSILVRNEDQLKCALDNNIGRIYTTDKKLNRENLIYRVPRNIDKIHLDNNKYLLTDYGTLYKYPNNYGDYYLNVTNHLSLDYLSDYASLITLSCELKEQQIIDIILNSQNSCEVLIYGHIELMLMKYCPLKYILNKNKSCNICQNNNKYFLKDRNDKLYPIITDLCTHYTSIMNYKPLDLIDSISKLKKEGLENIRIELLNENYEETNKIIERVKREWMN